MWSNTNCTRHLPWSASSGAIQPFCLCGGGAVRPWKLCWSIFNGNWLCQPQVASFVCHLWLVFNGQVTNSFFTLSDMFPSWPIDKTCQSSAVRQLIRTSAKQNYRWGENPQSHGAQQDTKAAVIAGHYTRAICVCGPLVSPGLIRKY